MEEKTKAEAAAAAATDEKKEVSEKLTQDVKPEGSHSATGLAGAPQRQANPAPATATSAAIGAGATSAATSGPVNCNGGVVCVTGVHTVSRKDAAVPECREETCAWGRTPEPLDVPLWT